MGRKKSMTTAELEKRIDMGEERSAIEWAEELFGDDSAASRSRVSSALSSLRRSGHMYFAPEIGGKIKDVSRNAAEFNHVFNRFVDQKSEPLMVRSFMYAERLIEEHPKLREAVVQRAKALISMAVDSNKSLLGISYGTRKDHAKKAE